MSYFLAVQIYVDLISYTHIIITLFQVHIYLYSKPGYMESRYIHLHEECLICEKVATFSQQYHTRADDELLFPRKYEEHKN
jgi:hypothetical protein